MRKMRKMISIIAVLCLLCSMAVPAFAATEQKTVTVACVDYPGMCDTDDAGTHIGFAVEYFREIAKTTGWNVQFVDMPWSEAFDAVKNGEVDFYCVARRNEGRDADFDFSTYPLLDEQMNLYALADSSIVYEDFARMNGMRIGMLENSEEIDCFREYMATNNFTADVVQYPSNAAAQAALEAGEVDAVALVGASVSEENLSVIATFGVVPAYLMSAENSGLMKAFNQTQQQLLIRNPEYFDSIRDTYFPHVSTICFTAEEQAYIANSGTITVGQLRNRYPLTNYDEKTGELSGINEDILALIADITGLTFESVPLELGDKPVEVIGSGSFDLIMGIMDNTGFRENEKLAVSDPYFQSTLSIVTKKGVQFDSKAPYTIAMKRAFSVLQDYITQNYPQYTVKFYDSDEQCLDAIQSGEADVVMQNVHVMNYLLQKPKYADFEILPTTFMSEHNAFLAQASVDPLLMSILNKAIAALDSNDVDNIILANTTAQPYQMTFGDVLYKYKMPIVLVSVLVVLCLVLLLGIIVVRQHSMQRLTANNARLAEAVNQAERANIAKSQFLSRMSHEIRTPMNAIVGLTTIAKIHDNEPEKVDEYLGKIDSSSKVLLSIINDVLDMSAIESEKMKIASAEFDLTQVLNTISSIYYTQCKNKGIDFNMGVDLTEETVVGDSLRVNQILMNLISNAYKFTDAGGEITVSVKEINRRDKKVFVRFVVADTGCGMSKEMLTRLFKPFEQETAQTAQKSGGSGLGLSIAKNLVDMMQGAIRVESEKGKGTTFTVDLPFALTGRVNVIDPDKLKNMRVLIVDDDENERLYTSVVLERIGIKYDVASSAEQALQKMDECQAAGDLYDICFTDWKMPGMNGIDLTKKIRSHFGKGTMVIIISAYDLSEVQDEAKQAGADLFITKPLFQSTVFNIMMQVTGGIVNNTEAKPGNYDFTGHRLLLAEDNEMNTEVATELLSLVHMAVDHAENGRAALEMFENAAPGTYDLILMDIQMPEMDGYQATEAIRASAHSQAKAIPIYAMTANAFTEDVSKSLSAGMNGHLAKPIDTAKLYQTLDEAIRKGTGA